MWHLLRELHYAACNLNVKAKLIYCDNYHDFARAIRFS